MIGPSPVPSTTGETAFVGASTPMQEVYHRIRRFGPSPVPILVLGETGTGKDLCAQALWEADGRRGPFVPVNCAAIPETLIDSELFGHKQGAFTSAVRSRGGLVAQADGGILFLDELPELSLATQAKLLRTIETGEYRPVGSDRTLHSQFRVIAATRPEIDRLVKQHRFRPDLLHRLGAVRIRMPPLRERLEDIPALVEAFLAGYRERNRGRGPTVATGEALELLRASAWPGNVRQLRNVVEAAAASAGPRTWIDPTDVADFLPLWTVVPTEDDEPFLGLSARIRWAEERAILEALGRAGGRRREAARLLEISPATLYRKLGVLRREGRFPSLLPAEDSQRV